MTDDVVGILLAAGQGRRFGGPKLSRTLADGRPIGAGAAANLLAVLPGAIAVVAAADNRLADSLAAVGCTVVPNACPERGMSHSLALAVAASNPATGWVVALGDMPWLAPASIAAVVAALRDGAALAAPVYQGRRGHPVGLASRWRGALLANTGDRGARAILARHAEQLQLLPVDDPGVLRDVDTVADLEP